MLPGLPDEFPLLEGLPEPELLPALPLMELLLGLPLLPFPGLPVLTLLGLPADPAFPEFPWDSPEPPDCECACGAGLPGAEGLCLSSADIPMEIVIKKNTITKKVKKVLEFCINSMAPPSTRN
ncbi:MAG TPA: hypothetical protein VFB79_21695 [Candidatus Angelobacter sp.]|nr:hypothetical protein [Candidatus Angelobacter sp.]